MKYSETKMCANRRRIYVQQYFYVFTFGFLCSIPWASNAAQPVGKNTAQIEFELQMTPLKVGTDCQPNSLSDKLSLKFADSAERRKFWLGQGYAIRRSYQESQKENALQRRAEQVDEDAADAIEAIERKRNDALLGIKTPRQKREEAEFLRELDQFGKQLKRDRAKWNAETDANLYLWMLRCSKYADDRSK